MGKPAQRVGRYKRRALARYGSLLRFWKQVDIIPENVGKVNAFKEDWNHLGDVPRILDNHGQPTAPCIT